jgi:hypothetical protein
MDRALRGLARFLSIGGTTMKSRESKHDAALCQLDEGRSYWVVIWGAQGTAAEVHPVGRWLTCAQALEVTGARLTSQRFSRSVDVREEVPRLLRVAQIAVEEKRPVMPSWKQAA